MLSARSLLLRSPRALPFAMLATLAACSSSSTTIETGDSGAHDSGHITPDTGTTADTGAKTDTGTKTDAGKKDAAPPTDASLDATPPSVPPPIPTAAKALATGYFAQVIGLTSDDYLIYYDKTAGISATDYAGNITQIAPGPTVDGGITPTVVGLGGQIVAVLTDYTTKTVSGQTEILEGTLSIWTHTLGKLQQVATNSTGIVNIDTLNSAYVIYTDGSNSAGTLGNIGITATTSGATGTDVLKNVVLDLASTSCAPFGVVDKAVIVTTSCSVSDAGVDSKPVVNAFVYNTTTSAWVDTTLAAPAAVSNVYGGQENTGAASENFATDTAGVGALTIAATTPGPTLQYQAFASTTAATILEPFTAPTSGTTAGTEGFILSNDGTFALFTQPNAHLGYATISTGASSPAIKTLNTTDTVLGIQTLSPDQTYDVDYSTALDMATGAPSSLFLRSIADGTSHALTSGSSLATTFGDSSWLTDPTTKAATYVLITTNLKATGATGASTGTLYTAAVPAGTINQLVTNTTVWDATGYGGTNIVYNQNYIENADFPSIPNGAATGDYYTVAANGTGQGKLLATGADAPDYFYITSDHSHIFLSYTYVNLDAATGEGSPFPADGIYSMALPATN